MSRLLLLQMVYGSLYKLPYELVDLVGLLLLDPVAATGDAPDLKVIHPLFKAVEQFDAKCDVPLSPDYQRGSFHLKAVTCGCQRPWRSAKDLAIVV